MNILYWAGLAFALDDHENKYAQRVNERIAEALTRFSPKPLSIVTFDDGTEIQYHMIGDGDVVADIFDRFGTRIGLGTQGNDEDHALEQFEKAQVILADTMKISHRFELHVWSWDSDAIPVAKPQLMV